jgi:hypothetical protein
LFQCWWLTIREGSVFGKTGCVVVLCFMRRFFKPGLLDLGVIRIGLELAVVKSEKVRVLLTSTVWFSPFEAWGLPGVMYESSRNVSVLF